MLLRQKLNIVIIIIAGMAALLTYSVSAYLLNNYLNETKASQREAAVNSIKQDIEVFDRLLLLVEQRWEEELALTLPKIAENLAQNYPKLSNNQSRIQQAELRELAEQYSVSDIHLINSQYLVFNSTVDHEIGLDMKEYGNEYLSKLKAIFNQNAFFTHRVSLSTATGDLKKYAYYSQAGSDIIVNADLDLRSRLADGEHNELADYLFGDYAIKLKAKYPDISFVDVFIVSNVDQWALFNTGERIEEELARRLFENEIDELKVGDSTIIHVKIDNYLDVGFKAYLKLDFDNSLLAKTRANLQLLLLGVGIIITLLSLFIFRYATKILFLDRFSSLIKQVKRAEPEGAQTISLDGSDELAQLGEEINNMMLRIKKEQDLNKWLTGISQKDGLTHIANRRAFDEKLELEWNKSKMSGSDLSLIMIDIDNFKAFNDFYGHVEGDKCLQAIASCLNEQLSRPSDFIARYGGEEFICVLSDTKASGALALAKQMQASVNELNIAHEKSPVSDRVTISLGCLTVNGNVAVELNEIVSHVDSLMYMSKHKGRNSITQEHIK
uniref:GGDEF domain-containing protein n=1 Tax=Ningiella ruwaisensis TaxID=2364274 RepID=UPI00109FE5BE|nr:GGDEF domain-containing protein [Ningiella ruwaisensis]